MAAAAGDDEAADIYDELRYLAQVLDELAGQGRLLLDGTPQSQQWPTTTAAIEQAEHGLAQAIEVIGSLRTLPPA